MTRFSTLTLQWRIWGLVAAALMLQIAVWLAVRASGEGFHAIGVWLQIGVGWVTILILAALGTNRIEGFGQGIAAQKTALLATADLVSQLEIRNALLKTLVRSSDIGLAFQTLASRIARVVECDRLGLALVKENGQTLQTFSARVTDDERRHRPRSELEFPVDRTIVGGVVTSREPLLATDLSTFATDFPDANVLHGAGFRSALLVPLVAKNRTLGALSLVSRSSGAFSVAHIEAVAPIAEILAVGILAQQLQVALGKYRAMETMAELSLVTSGEINSAVQIIVGQCSLLEREHPGLAGHRDLAQVVQQARRILDLLERMHRTTQERSREATFTTGDAGVPSSPEELADESTDS
jgi:hypothetical protein